MSGKALRLIFGALATLLLFTLLVLEGTWGFLRGTAGDFVVVLFLYTLVRVIKPTGWNLLPIAVFLFACTVEVMQYIDIISLLGITSKNLQIAVGSVFDWGDIIAYGVGCLVAALLDFGIRRHCR